MTAKQEYSRNRRRIQSAIRRLRNQGFLVPEDILPPIPKRITAGSVRRLEKITTEKIVRASRAVDVSTGEIVSGKEAQKIIQAERKERRRQRKAYGGASRPKVVPNYSDIVTRNFEREMINIFGRNDRLLNYVRRWYQRALQTYGKEDLAKALAESYANGEWPGWEAVSDEELLVGSLNAILELIGGSQGAREEIMEELEQGEDWVDY